MAGQKFYKVKISWSTVVHVAYIWEIFLHQKYFGNGALHQKLNMWGKFSRPLIFVVCPTAPKIRQTSNKNEKPQKNLQVIKVW